MGSYSPGVIIFSFMTEPEPEYPPQDVNKQQSCGSAMCGIDYGVFKYHKIGETISLGE